MNSNSVHQIGANGSSEGTPLSGASVMPHFFHPLSMIAGFFCINHKNYNSLACDWFKKVLFSTNSLAKLLSDSLLLDSLLLDSLLSDSSTSQSHSKM